MRSRHDKASVCVCVCVTGMIKQVCVTGKCVCVAGMISLKPPNFVMPTGEGGKGEIGYISSPNFQTKPTKVKAAIAHVPVATESLQRPPQSPGKMRRREAGDGGWWMRGVGRGEVKIGERWKGLDEASG